MIGFMHVGTTAAALAWAATAALAAVPVTIIAVNVRINIVTGRWDAKLDGRFDDQPQMLRGDFGPIGWGFPHPTEVGLLHRSRGHKRSQ